MKQALLFILLILPGVIHAGQATVAVASNFLTTLLSLQQDFEARTPHQLKVASGSTGKMFTQIRHGAPFDVFLAANQREPEKLTKAGLTQQESRPYALGTLVLASKTARSFEQARDEISRGKNVVVAMANPKLAPYGVAAKQVLDGWHVDRKSVRLATAENVSQTLAYLLSGSAQYAFVAHSQVLALEGDSAVRSWILPVEDYAPVAQHAVLLNRAKNNVAAQAFYTYLYSPAARQIIRESGYQLP